MLRKHAFKIAGWMTLAVAGAVPALGDSNLTIVATQSNFDALATPQQVQFMIYDGNSIPLAVESEVLSFQIMNETTAPIITDADILSGTIFGAVPNFGQYYPGVIAPGHQAIVGTDTVSGTVSPNGLLATLTLVTGTTPGTFQMTLGTSSGDTLLSLGFNAYLPAFPHGRFTVGNADRHWTKDGSGTWDDDLNWNPFAPYTTGDQANFLGAVSAGTATVSLDGNRTAGAVTFNNIAASYSIVDGTVAGSTLRMDNGLAAPIITNLGGNHSINTAVNLAASTTVSVAASSVLTLSGPISGAASDLNLTGPGTLVLSGDNAYAGTSIALGSTLNVGDGGTTGTLGNGAVSNTGTLVIDRSGAANFINAISGTGAVSIIGSATVTFSGASNYSGATLISSGTLRMNGATSHTIGSISGGGALQVDTGTTLVSGDFNIASLSLLGTAAHTIAPSSGYSKVFSLFIDHTGTGSAANYSGVLNLTNNRLVVEAGSLADKTSKIRSINEAIFAGHGGSNNTYIGTHGITSDTVAGDAQLAIGVFDNAALGRSNWAGGPGNVDGNSILVSPALKGDANLDGVVNFNDMLVVTGNWNASGLVNGISTLDWAHGDLNGDGIVNFNDMLVVTGNWNHTSSTFNLEAMADGSAGLEANPTLAQVPEPASLALTVMGGAALLLRRRRG